MTLEKNIGFIQKLYFWLLVFSNNQSNDQACLDSPKSVIFLQIYEECVSCRFCFNSNFLIAGTLAVSLWDMSGHLHDGCVDITTYWNEQKRLRINQNSWKYQQYIHFGNNRKKVFLPAKTDRVCRIIGNPGLFFLGLNDDESCITIPT